MECVDAHAECSSVAILEKTSSDNISVIDQARALRLEAEKLSLSRTATIENLQAKLVLDDHKAKFDTWVSAGTS